MNEVERKVQSQKKRAFHFLLQSCNGEVCLELGFYQIINLFTSIFQ